MKGEMTASIEMVKIIRRMLDEKKALKSVILDVRELSCFFDYFIIALGNSHIHCKAMAREIEKFLLKSGYKERGKPDLNSGWIVLDFNDIVVHLFTREMNDYYQLEKLWADSRYVE
jgi:ribosome-associated protein